MKAFLTVLVVGLFLTGTAAGALALPLMQEYAAGEALVVLKNVTVQKALTEQSLSSGEAYSYVNSVGRAIASSQSE